MYILYKRYNRLIIIFLLLSISTQSTAEVWVCIASYDASADAESYRAEATYEFVDSVSVMNSETALGRYFRVVVGPFDSVAAAGPTLADARRSRPDAWLVSGSVDEIDVGEADQDESWDESWRTDPQAAPRSPARGSRPSEAPPEQDVAPAGYNAHRLNRNSASTSD
jgi:hypothetical protein